MKALRVVITACGIASMLSVSACGGRSVEDRAREAQEIMKDSLGPDLEVLAMNQPIEAAVAKEVQENLTAIHEYQGEINGKFDGVTVNAIQAFQRTVGLKDDGIVNDQTRKQLQAAAQSAKQGDSAAKPAS